ncbi:MAG: class I SAM-dependent methyltransferase [Acidimicrobiia bacterium]|nr:class I SAM-dependent methyltransferase [Acidimicrobiia bacterium]
MPARRHAAITMATRGAKVIAIDPSPERLARTREVAEEYEVRIELHESDLADLAFVRADSVDLVFSAYVARHRSRARPGVPSGAPRPPIGSATIVFSLPHPAFAMVDTASNDPLRIRRS